MLSAKNARLYRSRKKNELVTLKEQAHRFEEQLNALRRRHHVLRADSAVACWEEKAIAQRLRRRQAEELNEQLKHALFTYTGVGRDSRSIFTESAPPSAALNMRHFLHMYTHLRREPHLRMRDLEAVGTATKINRAMQVVLRETATIPVFTAPEILFQELDLGAEGLGKTSTAVEGPLLFSNDRVLRWDFVDDDDSYPLKCSTFIKRDTVGALVLRPEVCADGVERMVCRNICTDMHILVNSPKPSLNVAEYALLEDMMVYESIKEGATDWQDSMAYVE
ncbi:hypothetical protein PInf_001592 [Phytophthora infestans]|nr:hypothetical protein PInf_001592 [Phytophthora infestans]